MSDQFKLWEELKRQSQEDQTEEIYPGPYDGFLYMPNLHVIWEIIGTIRPFTPNPAMVVQISRKVKGFTWEFYRSYLPYNVIETYSIPYVGAVRGTV